MIRSTRGVSIVEIAVAAGLLVTGLLPVVLLCHRGLVEAGVTQEEILGRQLLMDLCERYKSAKPADLRRVAAGPELIEKDLALAFSERVQAFLARTQPGSVTASGLRMRRSVDFEESYGGEEGLHRVRFNVSWASRNRPVQTVSLSRLLHYHE